MSPPLTVDAQRQADRSKVRRALNASLALVLLLWVVFIAQQGFDWRWLTVTPRSAAGLLGLRAMFFLLQGMADRFHLLPYGLALVLVFIGMKMLLIDVYKIPILVSLGVVAAIIATTVFLSLRMPPKSGHGGTGA